MIKTILVEDESMSLDYLKKMVLLHCPDIQIVGSAQSGKIAIQLIEELRPDLIFLDIELPDMDGFQLLQTLKKVNFEVIFVTAFSQYALRAFEYFALGYLLKPIEAERLKAAVEVAAKRTQKPDINHSIELMLQMVQSQQPKTIPLPTMTGFEIVEARDITHCESEGNYTIFHFEQRKSVTVSRQLGTYEKILPTNYFFRIHAKYIINKNFVTKYSKGLGGSVTLRSGVELPVSANRKNEFLEHFSR